MGIVQSISCEASRVPNHRRPRTPCEQNRYSRKSGPQIVSEVVRIAGQGRGRPMKIRETSENSKRMEQCPNFETCEAPKCPLDELYDVRVYLRGERRCRARKGTRIGIGGSLPNHGLFPREMRGIELYYGSWEQYVAHKQEVAKELGASQPTLRTQSKNEGVKGDGETPRPEMA